MLVSGCNDANEMKNTERQQKLGHILASKGCEN